MGFVRATTRADRRMEAGARQVVSYQHRCFHHPAAAEASRALPGEAGFRVSSFVAPQFPARAAAANQPPATVKIAGTLLTGRRFSGSYLATSRTRIDAA